MRRLGGDASRCGSSASAPRSVLARREHRGPLVVQKALYPEGPGVCQCVILHPPAGIVGGDRIVLTVSVGRGCTRAAHHTRRDALVSIRRIGRRSSNCTRTSPTERCSNGCRRARLSTTARYAASATRIDVAAGAAFIGTEIVSLGRRAAGERFRCGEWRQRFEIVRDGAPIWSERAVLKGDGELLASAVGLNGAPVFGTFVAVMPGSSDTMMPALARVVRRAGAGERHAPARHRRRALRRRLDGSRGRLLHGRVVDRAAAVDRARRGATRASSARDVRCEARILLTDSSMHDFTTG